MNVPRGTPLPIKSAAIKLVLKCGRCDLPKHKGGCRGVTKARHSKSWKATR